ncbi:hypothetical protein SUGI_1003670 [Cryptomeria japonica]|nr:hypothetical protein SUGI_1003670 [Cryptomeria japonica]
MDEDDNNNNNNNNPDLDHDAMKEILQRLPVPSLMRAKTVCKEWNTAISATNFYLNNETHHFVNQQSQHGIAFFCAALNRWFPICLPWNKHTWDRNMHYHPHPTKLYLCAASEGLFLFVNFQNDPVIFNLLTKQHRFLPRPKGWITGGPASELIIQAGHFEIIVIGIYHDRFQLYDSTTDAWKDIPATADFLEIGEYIHSWKSTLHKDMAYFTNDYGHHLGCYDIACREFQFKEIEGGRPPKIDSRDLHNNSDASLPSLVACNGKLFLVGRLEKEAGEGRVSIWGGFPFIEHTLLGIWELDSRVDDSKNWSLISVTPQDLLEETVKSSHGTDFMVAASSEKIWFTIRGSRNLLTLNLRSMEWKVLPGYSAEDLVDCVPRRAICAPFSISPSLSLSTNPKSPLNK